MFKLCFLIRQLNDGGAQRQLMELVKGLDKSRYGVTVLTFYDGGRFADELRQVPQVRLISLGKSGRWDVARFLVRLIVTVRRLRPHVLHGYLGTANILAVLLKPFIGGARIVWGLRAAHMDWSRYDWLQRATFRLQGLLAPLADLIIVNSRAGRDYHLARGYPAGKTVVIPNGFDTERFRPDPDARRRVRREWGVAEGERLIGLVGRVDPMKDHPTFLRAAAIVSARIPDARFVCVGDGPLRYWEDMRVLADRLGLSERLIWAGARGDMPAVYNALDLLCSSSIGEGFPNAIGEAMACGVPCVVTDVGDSAWIVGESGLVVPPRNPEALAEACVQMLARVAAQRAAVADKVRSRIVTEFDRGRLVRRTSEALEGLL